MGGAAGLVGADLLLGVLNRWQPFGEAHLAASVDARVYLAGLAFTLGSALLFGMVPARQAWQSSPLQMMKSGPVDSMHLRRFALRDLLLGAQIAICTLLVTASLVAVRGMVRALHAPLGFQPQGAMLADMDLSQVGQAGDVALEKEKAMIEAVRSIPGVTAAGTVSRTPMTGGMHGIPIFRPGTTEFKLNNSALAPYVFTMSPGYLEAAGTRLLSGRDVSWQDTAKTPNVADRERNLRAEDVGRDAADRTALHSVGQPDGSGGRGRRTASTTTCKSRRSLRCICRCRKTRRAKRSSWCGRGWRRTRWRRRSQRTLSGIDPNVPISVQSWSDALGDELFPARAATVALGVMGLLAAMLAVTGIFGMAAYSVSRRMKELGIRVALGARRTQVMSAAVGRPMVLLGVGSALGLLAGVFASRLLGQIVYQANPRDPVVLGGAVLTMALLGIAASAIPARRALAVDPSKLMREE